MPRGNDQRREFHKRSDDVTEINDRAEDQQANENEMAAAAKKKGFMRVNGERARDVEETNRGNQKPNVQSLVAHHVSIQKRTVVTTTIRFASANHSHVVDKQTPYERGKDGVEHEPPKRVGQLGEGENFRQGARDVEKIVTELERPANQSERMNDRARPEEEDEQQAGEDVGQSAPVLETQNFTRVLRQRK